MKYKLIALDLDGTLKSSKKDITPATKEILTRLAKKGIIIVLASGRPAAGMEAEAKELELDKYNGYVLSFNGARVINYTTKEVVYENTFNSSIAHDIYDRAKGYNLAVMTYNDKEIISEDKDDKYVIGEGDTTHLPIRHVDSFKDFVCSNVNKVLLTGEPDYVEQIIDEFKKPYGSSLSIYRSAPYFIEVMNEGIDKAISLKTLIEHLGINKEEIIAFGDGYNDLSMVEFAGFGVAMGNGVEQVKEKADYITESNDDDGIAVCLKMLEEKGEI